MSQARVEKALVLWGMPDAQTRLIAQRENVVWRVDHAGKSYALRLHRPGYRTLPELRSELQWMAALDQQGLRVPGPIKAADGALVHEIDGIQTDMLTWLEGAPIGALGQFHHVDDPLGLCHQVGREMARLHDVTDQWPAPLGFTRPDWRADGLLGEDPLWGRFWRHPHLAARQRDILQTARAEARVHLAEIEAELDQGLIHADLLTENILIHNGHLSLIDFDDSAFGYRDFELATFLIRFQGKPGFDNMRDALCDGYARRRRVLATTFDFMLFLRALTYVGWIISRLDEPGGAERSARNITIALPMAEAYLKRRHS